MMKIQWLAACLFNSSWRCTGKFHCRLAYNLQILQSIGGTASEAGSCNRKKISKTLLTNRNQGETYPLQISHAVCSSFIAKNTYYIYSNVR
jgi:hypothetical protein